MEAHVTIIALYTNIPEYYTVYDTLCCDKQIYSNIHKGH
jgi:hypothetical protein